jgi:hypothetical protein
VIARPQITVFFFQRYLLPALALLDHYLCLPLNDWPAKWDNRVKDRLAGGKVALALVKKRRRMSGHLNR